MCKNLFFFGFLIIVYISLVKIFSEVCYDISTKSLQRNFLMMKKKLFFLILTFAIFALTLCLSSCDWLELPHFGNSEAPPKTYKVMLSLPEGVSVNGSNPITVTEGESAQFSLRFSNDCMFASVTHGTYRVSSRTVVINNVTENISATLAVNRYDFDTSRTFKYIFYESGRETSNVVNGAEVNAGIVVSVSANNFERRFVGWTLGANYINGGRLVSNERNYSFVMNADYADENGMVLLYPNYADTNQLYYHPNGGSVNLGSANCLNTSYYSVSKAHLFSDVLLKVKVFDTYLSKVESYSTFYDDGTFYRNGYVLKEYNTKPDGTGDSYSLGSKVYFPENEEYPVLYCIWAEQTPADAFIYKDITIKRPVNAAYAPDWKENGVIITKYTGNAETVVIPEMLGNRYVIAIADSAFVNKDVKTLVFNRRLIKVENGAFRGCSSLNTIYYPDGLYEMYNEALDADSYKSLKNFYVNATIAPRFSKSLDGAHSVKMSRLLAGADENRIIVIGGSSVYEGLGTDYLEALLDGNYRVINFGTTRTTHCTMYLEAMSGLAHEGDIVIYSPENSSYQLGERELYWKTLRDLEGMNNVFRYIDISNYTNVFSAFTDFNKTKKYTRAAVRYEQIVECTVTTPSGDHTKADRQSYVNFDIYNPDVYYHTLNGRIKTKLDTNSNDMEQEQLVKLDFQNKDNPLWCSIDEPYYLDVMNRIIDSAKTSGAKVYFGFCPTDGESLVEPAMNLEWIRAYDKLIEDVYNFDGSVGRCEDYVYSRIYFYDNAFHLNDYGRTYRTYQFYIDLAEILGIDDTYGITELGTYFEGCLFEPNTTGKPRMKPIFLMEE